MTLPPFSPKCFTASCVVSSVPRTFRLKCRSKFSLVTSSSGRERVNARVVHQDVQRAERLPRLGEEAHDVLLLADVALHGDGFAPGGGDLRHGAVRTLAAGGVVDDDGGAIGGELLGDAGPDALRGSGDDGDFSFEFFHDGFFPLRQPGRDSFGRTSDSGGYLCNVQYTYTASTSSVKRLYCTNRYENPTSRTRTAPRLRHRASA